jgi:hypothetical protein
MLAVHTRRMSDNHTVTVFASSTNPKDWGRALADAMSELSSRLAGDDTSDQGLLLGKKLVLDIHPRESGVDITVSWSPGQQDGPAPG